MAREREDDTLAMKVANSAAMLLISRVGTILVLGLCTWILSSVAELKTQVGVVNYALPLFDKRIENLEAWRNSYEPAPPAAIRKSSVGDNHGF